MEEMQVSLTPGERQRFKRHLLLPQVGEEGQIRLKNSRVLIAGAGGLGSPLALYLAAAGVGTIGLVDFDRVDVTNLQRQILYGEQDVGELKVHAAAKRLKAMNHAVHVEEIPRRLDGDNAQEIVSGYDLVADALDDLAARYVLNDACVKLHKPEVYGAIYEFSGQVAVFDEGTACLRCLNPDPPKPGEMIASADVGVLGVLPGLVGCIQAAELLKMLLGTGGTLEGRMLFIDALQMRFEEMELPANPRCPLCGGGLRR